MTRYTVRAWERFSDGNVEAAIVDNHSGDTKARFVEQETKLAEATMYLSVDPTVKDCLQGGNGASLYYVEEFSGPNTVQYQWFYGGGRSKMWQETKEDVANLDHMLKDDTLIPIETTERPSTFVMPSGWDQ